MFGLFGAFIFSDLGGSVGRAEPLKNYVSRSSCSSQMFVILLFVAGPVVHWYLWAGGREEPFGSYLDHANNSLRSVHGAPAPLTLLSETRQRRVNGAPAQLTLRWRSLYIDRKGETCKCKIYSNKKIKTTELN